jgi:hypothetical protein
MWQLGIDWRRDAMALAALDDGHILQPLRGYGGCDGGNPVLRAQWLAAHRQRCGELAESDPANGPLLHLFELSRETD